MKWFNKKEKPTTEYIVPAGLVNVGDTLHGKKIYPDGREEYDLWVVNEWLAKRLNDGPVRNRAMTITEWMDEKRGTELNEALDLRNYDRNDDAS